MRIKVNTFEGPLDLLLQLIEDEKLDITEISLAHVTEQFLAYMRSLSQLRPYELADWLNIAAKLLVIKSKALAPMLTFTEEEESDAGNLAWQLYHYKKFKEAAALLKSLEEKNRQGWGRSASSVRQISFYPDPSADGATLANIMHYLARALEKINAIPKKILEEVVTIAEKIEHLQKMISAGIETRLKDLIHASKSKTETIVTFLALLELVKQRILSVEQETIFADIVIKKQA